MSFFHPMLLAGLGLVAIPVILHMWLRPRPKRLPFPALRLLMARQKQNTRRLRLRHLWLLLLRMAVIACMVIAVTRPTLPPANYALTWTETLVAAGILGVALGTYFGVMHAWTQRGWPRHVWLTKRTVLRGIVGAATASLLLVAVAWPYQRRVAAEIVAPRSNTAADLPVMAVYVFDTSLSMQYQRQNRTRLDVAVELAGAHLGRLPSGSKAAIAETAAATPTVFSSDMSAAQNRVDGLKAQPLSRPMEDRLLAAITALENDRKKILSDQSGVAADLQQDRFLREVYIFTDLAKSAWRAEPSARLREEIAARPWLGIYLVDVGVDDPVNVSLTNMKLSREAVPAGGQAFVEATLRRVGEGPAEQTVEIELRDESGAAVKSGQQTVPAPPGGEALVRLPIDAKHSRYQQGQLKIVGADPLSMDDQLYFTVRILPPRRVLVVADRKADVESWMVALESLDQGKRTAFQDQFATTAKLSSLDLEEYDVVCLINAGRPATGAWERLRTFVDAGGGLFVVLGTNFIDEKGRGIDPVAYNDPNAQEILPAKLKGSVRFPLAQPGTIDLRDKAHPLVQRMDEFGAIPDLSTADIRWYWNVTADPASTVVAPYVADAETSPPALLERAVGRGRVLMLTTAVNSNAWNDLLGAGWSYLALADQITGYLNASAIGRSNWTVGNPVTVRIDPDSQDRTGILRMPDFKQLPRDIPKLAESLTLRDLSAPGHYELVPANENANLSAGFSLNLPSAESDLTKLTKKELDDLLGEQRYAIARELESLVRNVQAGRLGQEVYGLVLAVLIGVFVLEQIAGTWFYRTDESAPTESIRSAITAKPNVVPKAAASRV